MRAQPKSADPHVYRAMAPAIARRGISRRSSHRARGEADRSVIPADSGIEVAQAPRPAWNAIVSIAIGVAGLIIAEFLPAGMLTPMASDLGVTEGMTGQAVTATSIFAVITSLVLAFITRKLDRRHVLLGLSCSLVVSNFLVAYAPTFSILLVGRVLLGIALGGFWSMASSTATRLVPTAKVPRAIAIIFAGSSFASVFAAPMSSFLGNVIGWRHVFLLSGGLSIVALAWQALTIPALKPVGETKFNTLFAVLRVPQFSAGMLAVALAFCGHFAAFTYLRPFLERTTAVGPNELSAILLAFGAANFIGTSLSAVLMGWNFRRALIVLPLLLAVAGVGFAALSGSAAVTTGLIMLWGAVIGPVPVLWSAWVARKVPDQAETAGGIFVAAIQLSAAVGAMAGGAVFDSSGSTGVVSLSALSWLLSAVVVGAFIKTIVAATAREGAAVAAIH
jgi:predicted MFS family arabinose efflux permease